MSFKMADNNQKIGDHVDIFNDLVVWDLQNLGEEI